ncbi:MAG: oligosaccharide repeat unit polymerase [Dysgonamonadaceae bacterium]|jgi:oligosaccharide repeat unit polymerase|nr:oligosaccharide repeat unit polymerase [Dysgonamonadaceae bacterium]
MLNILLPLLLISFLFFWNHKLKQSWISPSSLLLTLYFLSILLAYPYIVIFNQELAFQGQYIEASVAFCLFFLLFIYPFISFRETQITKIILPNQKTLKLFSIIICVFSIYSVIYFIPTTILALTHPSIIAARQAMVERGEVIVSQTIFNTIAGTAASFYQIPIILFFVYQILGQSKVLKTLLFISSTSYIFFVFSAFGRDGILFWFLSFLGIMGFFYSFLDKKILKKIFVILIIGAVIGGIGFMVITFSRFEDAPHNAIISYMGQGIPNFFLAYEADAPISNGASFPLFRALMGLPEDVDRSLQMHSLERAGTYSWVFGTFLKEFILSLGVSGTVLLGLLMFTIFKTIIKNRRQITFSSLFVYFLYFQILYQGVFYFRQTNRVGNLLIIVCFVFYYTFILLAKIDKNKIIIKK